MIQDTSLYVRNQFLNLDVESKKQVCKELTNDQRMMLIEIVLTEGGSNHASNSLKAIEKCITEINHQDVGLTRLKDKSNPIHQKAEKVKKIGKKVMLQAKKVTGSETCRIINEFIVNKESLEGKKVDQGVFIKIIELAKSEKIPVSEALEKAGYSKELVGIDLSAIDENHKGINLQGLDFSGVVFNGCNLYWPSLSGCILRNTEFKNSEVNNVSFMNAQLENCIFNNCSMREVMFTGAKLDGVVFQNSSLICASFEDASIKNCTFVGCTTAGSHFLEAKVENSSTSP